MKKTNILVEVDDNVYDLVVNPHKKAKTFSKLVASLLTGYIEDSYIRSYTEGTLEDMKKASVSALDDVLNSMNESLSSMGLYTDELKSTNEQGTKYFSKKVEPPVHEGSEVDDLKKSVDELKRQNQDILDILRGLVELPKGITEAKEERVEVEKVDKADNSWEAVEEVEEDNFDLNLEEEEDDEESGLNAADAMSALLMGNSYSF